LLASCLSLCDCFQKSIFSVRIKLNIDFGRHITGQIKKLTTTDDRYKKDGSFLNVSVLDPSTLHLPLLHNKHLKLNKRKSSREILMLLSHYIHQFPDEKGRRKQERLRVSVDW
jgi:hypothetical protein